MNNDEAVTVLERELAAFRGEPYHDLARRVLAGPLVCERRGASGAQYQVEIQFIWDAKPGGPVRVVGSIDDGGLRAFVPLTREFIKSAATGEP